MKKEARAKQKNPSAKQDSIDQHALSEEQKSQQKTSQHHPSPENKKISTADKLKFLGLLLFFVIVIALGVMALPYFEKLATEEGRLALIHTIQSAGIAGIGICLVLQFIQIVVAFIPGEMVQLAIGAIYGPLGGTLITVLGALLSSIFVFYLVRRLGAPFVQGMIGSKNTKALNFIREDSRLNVIVFVLFLIPGLPKDVFTYLVPLTPMRPLYFFVLSTLGRIPGIAASAYIGNAAIQGDYTQAIIVGIIAGGLGLLGIIFNKKIVKVVGKVEAFFKKTSTPS